MTIIVKVISISIRRELKKKTLEIKDLVIAADDSFRARFLVDFSKSAHSPEKGVQMEWCCKTAYH